MRLLSLAIPVVWLLLWTAAASGQSDRKKLIEFGWDEPDTAFLREHIAAMQKTPDFVRKAIAKYPVAVARWQKLAKSHKRNAMIYLMDGKSQSTRERRAENQLAVFLCSFSDFGKHTGQVEVIWRRT